MTDEERIKLGLTKKLTYRYAYGSGDIHNAGNKSTYFLRAMARMGLYGPSTEKYFTPDSVNAIKAKEKDPNFQTKLVNPIYISDAQVPLEYFEIEETGGQALYDYDEEPPRFLGFAPIDKTKKVIRAAERNLSPPGTKFGLEGSNGNGYIPPEGTTSDIKNIKASNFYYTSSRQNGAVPAKFEAVITLAGAKNTFVFDATGYITVLGIKYSALQVLDEFDNKTALNWFRENLKGDTEANNILDSWGLVERKPVEQEGKEGIPDREEDADADPNAPKEENKTEDEVRTQTDTSSITEKINILRGWIVKDGKVQYDTKGKPKKSNDKNPQLRVSDTVNITVESDGSVNIDGDVQINVADKKDAVRLVENGKFTIPFGKINGNFNCQKLGLTTLANAPKIVNGTFDCSKNNLTTLVGAPQEVGRFIASDNKSLKSLAGGSKVIKGITDTSKNQKEYIYDVSGCGLTSLDGNGITSFGPGGFSCAGNKITSLSGLGVVATTGVTKFDCSNNELTSLNGIPKPVKDAKTGKPGDYWIKGNVGVTVFPASMAEFEVDQFVASGLALTSLSFAPKQVYGNFDCSGNKGTTKLTNQSIGKDRFKIGGGFEEDAGNRIVKIDGEFITSEGIWGDKTYDINTLFKKSTFSSADTNFEATKSGNIISLDGGKVIFTEIPNPSTIRVLYKRVGEYQKPGNGIQFEFEAFMPIGGAGTSSYNRTWQAGFAKGRPNPFIRFRGWEEEFPNIKNYINWSMFERGDEGWGWGQPTGAFIVNGVNYGGKTVEDARKYASMFWISANGPNLGRGNAIYKDGGNSKVNAVNAINNSKGIRSSAPGSALVIENGSVKSWTPEQLAKLGLNSGTSFIGHTNGGVWFAGTSGIPDPGIIGSAVQKYYKGSVKNMGVSDGSGSRQCFINGKKYAGGGRPVTVALAW